MGFESDWYPQKSPAWGACVQDSIGYEHEH